MEEEQVLVSWAKSPCAYGSASAEVPQRTAARRNDVDGLRAVAVVMVVLYHMRNSWCPGGFVGVDVFFVISGFVVCTSLLQRTSATVLDFLLSFAARRVKRLLPVALFVIAVAAPGLAAVAPLSFSAEIKPYLKVAGAGLLGNANTWLYLTANSYLDPEKEGSQADPFLHLWSLGVEEQFYVVFPLIVVLGLGTQAAKDAWWEPSAPRMWFLLALAATGSLMMCWWWSSHDRDAAFYLLPARFWELGAGVALALLAQSPGFKMLMQSPTLNMSLQALAVLLLTASLLFLRTQGPVSFPFPGALLPVSAAVLLIAAGCSPEPFGVSAVLAAWLPAYVGRLSYSIYLWHMPVLAVWYWCVSTTELSSAQALATLALLPLLVCLLAAFTYHRIEVPLQELRAESLHVLLTGAAGLVLVLLWGLVVWWVLEVDLSPRADELALCLAAVVIFVVVGCQTLDGVRGQPLSLRLTWLAFPLLLVLLAGYGIHQGALRDRSTAPQTAALVTRTTAAQCVAQPCACRKRATLYQPPCAIEEHEFHKVKLPPCFDDSKRRSDRAFSALGSEKCDCHVEKALSCATQPTDAYSCLARTPGLESQPQVVLLGDSKAWQLLPAFKRIFRGDSFKFFTWNAGGQPETHQCRHALPALQKALRPGDFVLLSTIACKQYDDCRPWDFGDRPGFFDGGDQWYQDLLVSLVRAVGQQNATLVLVEGNPLVPPSGRLTLEQQQCRSELCRATWSRARRAANVSSNVLMLSYSDLLCDTNSCGTNIPGTLIPAKADGMSHLTTDAVDYLSPFLCSRLANLGLGQFFQKRLAS